jgi:putative ABC transport system ATP-binding protein
VSDDPASEGPKDGPGEFAEADPIEAVEPTKVIPMPRLPDLPPALALPMSLRPALPLAPPKSDEAERVRKAEEEIARMAAEQTSDAQQETLTQRPLSLLDDVDGLVEKGMQHESIEALAPALPAPDPAVEGKPKQEPALQLVDVAKSYYKGNLEVRVLDGLDLEVPQGNFEALMGPSGSGKSTLLHLIAGLDRPTAGSIRVAGADLGSMSEEQLSHWRARTIGFIFQHYNLLPALTAAQNVELPLLLRKELTKAQRRERVRIALRVVGLEERQSYRPRELSGGQEQRVAIARAIVTDPKILICDEPTGDLDRQSADAVLDLLVELNRQFHKTIFMVTHDPEAASRATHRRVLSKGRLT